MKQIPITIIQDYFSKQPIEKAWIFGSFSRGEEKKDSDIDIMVRFSKDAKISLLKYSIIILELQKLLNRNVDLVEEGQILPFAKESIEQDKKLIYERNC